MSVSRDPDFAGHLDHVKIPTDHLTPVLWSLAAMTAHTINNLAHPTTLNDEPDPDFESCDPDECAPCEGLFQLHEAGVIDHFLRHYVTTSGTDWDWWVGDAETGHLDWAYVEARSVRGAHAHYYAE